MKLRVFMSDFFSLFYPPGCEVCSQILAEGETHICSRCWYKLPRTNYQNDKNNPLSRVFWGRVGIESACSMFFYQKGGVVQQLIHQFKYRGHRELGLFLGVRMGRWLARSGQYKDIDGIVPVPLHEKKRKKRGFNQSEILARGIGQAMGLPVYTTSLLRISDTRTQTRKRRFFRWENVESVFAVENAGHLERRNLLLVDDVITTGSTMDACAGKLLSIEGVRVWIAAVGATV